MGNGARSYPPAGPGVDHADDVEIGDREGVAEQVVAIGEWVVENPGRLLERGLGERLCVVRANPGVPPICPMRRIRRGSISFVAQNVHCNTRASSSIELGINGPP